MEQGHDLISLGDKIELIGFRAMDGKQMVIIRKIVGNYVKKYMDLDQEFKCLKLNMKTVHDSKYEIKGEYVGKTEENSNFVERNVFICLDSLLKKFETILNKN